MASLTLVCPVCQTAFPADAGLADLAARRAVQAAFGLWPAEISAYLVRYLGLFSPPQRALRLDKLARLVDELVGLVQAGTVTRHRDPRPAPLAAWGSGLAEVLKAHEAGSLTLPLTGHGLLCEIVHRAAGQAQQRQAAAERPLHPSHRVLSRPTDPLSPTLPRAGNEPVGNSDRFARSPQARQAGLRQVGALAQALAGRATPLPNPGLTAPDTSDNHHE